jgi:hypothetical protein
MSTERVQQEWIDFAAAVRRKLHDDINLIPAMGPTAQKTFIEACTAAYWLEHNAHIFTGRVNQYAREPWEGGD